jgi:hypothetical protein
MIALIIIFIVLILIFAPFDCGKNVWKCPKCGMYHDGHNAVGRFAFDTSEFAGDKVCDFCQRMNL